MNLRPGSYPDGQVIYQLKVLTLSGMQPHHACVPLWGELCAQAQWQDTLSCPLQPCSVALNTGTSTAMSLAAIGQRWWQTSECTSWAMLPNKWPTLLLVPRLHPHASSPGLLCRADSISHNLGTVAAAHAGCKVLHYRQPARPVPKQVSLGNTGAQH